SPGEYAVEPGITRVSEVINRAGGLLYMASNQAELTRIRVTQMGPVTDHILINLEKALQNDPEHDIPLENNDYLFVRAVPEWALYRTVTVTGEVKYPGTYTVRKGETLSSLIERAGGYTDKAYLKGAIFLRESVREEQQRSIDEMVDRLERELYSVGTAATATSFTAEEAQIVERETQQKRKLLEVLRRTKATGRVVVRLEDPPELLKRTPFDIELEEGDRLHIPKKPQTVQVVGSVLNETSFVFEPYRHHSYYVQKAGGYGVNADRKRTYLLKADGSAVRVGHLKKPPYLEEGDTVVVPEKIQVTSTMRDTAHLIDIVYKVAISAAVVVDALEDD
ncbi:MAG TPA: polysaccharide export protein, partial [Synergistaceae bacterium]|nr:polysaccharide export protein [Synergistaceae bacterium]